MSSEWPAIPAAELEAENILLVQDGNHGEYRPRSDDFTQDGVSFIRAADLADGRIRFDAASRINEAARRRITKGVGAPGDTIVSHKGTVGRVAWVPYDCEAFVCSPQTTFWRSLDPGQLHPRYLNAFIRSPNFQRQLDGRKGESDMAPYVSLTAQRSLLVTMPPISEQRRIAGVLGALDDKIEHTEQLAARLLGAAQAEYELALRTDRRSTSVGEIASFHNKRRIPLSAAQRRTMKGVYPYYGATGVIDYVADFLFDDIFALVGEDGSVVRDDGTPVTQYVWGRFWVNNHAHVLTGHNVSTESLYLALSKADVRAHVTGAVQPKLSMARLKEVQIELPVALDHLESILRRLFGLLRALKDESETLHQLRDALLPNLVSGVTRVANGYDPDGVLGAVAEAAGVAVS